MFKFIGRKKRLAIFSYIKIFISFVLIVLITNTILSSSMYLNYERHSLELVQSNSVEELLQISYSTKYMFETAKMTLIQLYSNPAVIKLMNYDHLSELELGSLLQQVGVGNINLPFVNSIYIYNKQAGKMFCDGKAFSLSTFPDHDIVNRLNNQGEINSLRPLARRIPATVNYTSSEKSTDQLDDVYTFVLYEGNTNDINNAIVLNVSQEWLKNTIESMDPKASSETMIVDSHGVITLGNESFKYLDNINSSFDFSDRLAQDNQSGYLVKRIDNKKYLVTYVSSAILDWKYIRLTPYEFVFGRLRQILFVTMIIFVLVTGLSVIAVLLFSKNIYGVFNKKIGEIEKKYTTEKNSGYEKKQQYLRMLSMQSIDEHTFKAKFTQYNIDFNLDKSFMTIVFRIDRYGEYCGRYNLEDRELFSYGCINIISELASNALFRTEAVDLGQGLIGVILNPDDDNYEAIADRVEGLVKEIQNKIEQYLDISFSAAIGDILDEITEVHASMAKCIEALDYKLFYGVMSLIYASGIAEMKKKEYEFPKNRMEKMIDHLLLGQIDLTADYCRKIIEGTRGYSVNSLQTTVLQMIVMIKEALKKHDIFANEVNCDYFISSVNHITSFDSLEEICDKLQELFTEVACVLSRSQETIKRHEKYSGIVENVEKFLENEFANPNLSPEMIAEHFEISSKYLRTLYKKASGESLGENINRYRMERAKDFLKNTEYSVNDVAFMSGFLNINYFYTLFKKYNNITPNEFRSIKTKKSK